MIISCPNCATRFVLEDAAIPEEGRKVRCIRCEHVWHQTPMVQSAPDTADQPERLIIDDTVEAPADPSSGPMLDQSVENNGGSRWWMWLLAVIIAVGAAGAYMAVFMPADFERLKASVLGAAEPPSANTAPASPAFAPEPLSSEPEPLPTDGPVLPMAPPQDDVMLDDVGMELDDSLSDSVDLAPSEPASDPSGGGLN